MNNSRLKTFLLLSTILCAVAFAEREERGHNNRPIHKSSPIERLDTDGDQQLSQEEFSQSRKIATFEPEKINQLFTRLDKNEDNYLTEEELPTHEEDKKRKRAGFETLDTNKDSKVSKEEFLAVEPRGEHGSPERREKLFSHLDRNADGFLTKEDRPKPGEPTHRHGPRGGKAGKGATSKMIEQRIERLDSNQDGELSLNEFLAGERVQQMEEDRAQKAFRRLDRNNDGVISTLDIVTQEQEDWWCWWSESYSGLL